MQVLDLGKHDATRCRSKLGENLIQFDEPLTLLKMGNDLRKEWLESLGQCGIGAVADSYPDHRGFLCGGEQEQVLKVFIFCDDGPSIGDGVGPDLLIH